MFDIRTVFYNFEGAWSFTREMSSHDGTSKGSAIGKANFDKVKDNLLVYHEEGIATFYPDNTRTEFFRDYTYSLGAHMITLHHQGGQQHGELYQSYTLHENKLLAIENHFCGPDIYQGLYELIDEDIFSLTTHVEGPNKDNIIKTKFQRMSQKDWP